MDDDERIETPYGDLWYVVGKDGTLVPMYSDRLCALAAADAYVRGNWDALTSVEIAFFQLPEPEIED